MQSTLTPTDVAARLRFAIVRASRRMRQEALGAEGGAALSPTLTAALATIGRHGPLTPSELAERERVRRPTATRTVSTLEDLGLVSRAPHPDDGRASLVATTPAGSELLRRLGKRKTAYLAKRLGGLDAEELATLERAAQILERMLEADPPTGELRQA